MVASPREERVLEEGRCWDPGGLDAVGMSHLLCKWGTMRTEGQTPTQNKSKITWHSHMTHQLFQLNQPLVYLI